MTNHRKEKIGRVMEFDMVIRGAYLSHVITIEELVKDIISYHFCSDEDNRKQFVSMMLNGRDYTFVSGIETLEKLLNMHYHEVTQRYPKLIDDLNKIRSFRDSLGHSMLDTSDEFLAKNYTDRIRLILYDDRGQTKYKEVTRSEIDERLEDCIEVQFALVDTRVEVRDRGLTKGAK